MVVSPVSCHYFLTIWLCGSFIIDSGTYHIFMESKHASIIFPFLISLALFSFILCILTDLKRFKEKGEKVDGRLCHVQGSHGDNGVGVAAVTCLAAAQIIGNLLLFTFCTGSTDLCCFFPSRCDDDEEMEEGKKSIFTRKPTSAAALMLFSWLSFGTALLLISAATIMKKDARLWERWLDWECYRVKNGVFTGAAVLLILSVSSTIGSAILMMRHKQEQSKKAISKSQEKQSQI